MVALAGRNHLRHLYASQWPRNGHWQVFQGRAGGGHSSAESVVPKIAVAATVTVTIVTPPEMLYGAFFVGRGTQCVKRLLVQCPSNSFCSCAMTLGKNLIAKAPNYRANWQGWAGRLHQVGDGEDH